jgi:hypothetical protein
MTLRNICFKIQDSDLATLNLRLSNLGYESVGAFVRAFARGMIPNDVLGESLAVAIAERWKASDKVSQRSTLPSILSNDQAWKDSQTLSRRTSAAGNHEQIEGNERRRTDLNGRPTD